MSIYTSRLDDTPRLSGFSAGDFVINRAKNRHSQYETHNYDTKKPE
ncbi:hypothetical protein B194_4864 [Serratia plymuthica A30]|nr:hypothetical protein B194_4864 [Serratia plymuthica A30]